jgi:DNA-binding transcriptional ArsR family regulator
MTEPQHREVQDVWALKALAHPLRQQILRHLGQAGPATSTTLARDLGENSGIMSYHLRLLARHGFVEEIPERRHGKERWWQIVPEHQWIPRGQPLSPAARAALTEMHRLNWADDLEQFARFRAGRDAMGAWATGTWASGRSTLTLTRDEAAEFLTEHQRLISRYQRGPENAPSGARTVIIRFLTYPEPPPEQRDVPEDPREAPEHDS